MHPDPGLGQGAPGVGNAAHVARWPLQTHVAVSFTWNLVGHGAAGLNLSQDRRGFTLFMVVDVERDLSRIGDRHEDAVWTTRGWSGRDGGGSGSAAKARDGEDRTGDSSGAQGELSVNWLRAMYAKAVCSGRLVEGEGSE